MPDKFSYPRPLVDERNDPAGTDGKALSVLPFAHFVATRTLPLLASPGLHSAAMPLIEELLPLLAASIAPDGSMSASAEVRYGQYLSILSDSVLSATGCDDKDVPLKPAVMTLLSLSVRLLHQLPAGAAAKVAPKGLLDVLARALTDAAVMHRYPNLHRVALPLLETARPDVSAVLRDVEAAGEATEAANAAAEIASKLSDGLPVPSDCASTVKQ
eukprot:scaffold289030_cov31-Prasinocladus_malaysianus.AAC.1